MKAYYSDHFVLPLPDGHRFPMANEIDDIVALHLATVRVAAATAAAWRGPFPA